MKHWETNGKTKTSIQYFMTPTFSWIANTKPEQIQFRADKALSYHFNDFLNTLKKTGNLILFYKLIGDIDENLNVSESTIQKWFEKDFPDTKISHHPTDYCETCAMLKKVINSSSVSISKYSLHEIRNNDQIKYHETRKLQA